MIMRHWLATAVYILVYVARMYAEKSCMSTLNHQRNDMSMEHAS